MTTIGNDNSELLSNASSTPGTVNLSSTTTVKPVIDYGYAGAIAGAAKCLELLRLYAAPTLTLACVTGTCLILYSAAKSGKALNPKYYVLVVLTLVDCLTMLLSAFSNEFLHYGLALPIPHVVSSAACKLWSLVWIPANGLSANLLCFLAIDRLFAVAKPIRHRASMTSGRYCLLLALFCAPFVAAGIFGVATFHSYEFLGQRHCYIAINGLPNWLGIAFQAYTTLITNGTLGSCFLLVANAALAWRIVAASRRRARYYRPSLNGGESAAGAENPRENHGAAAAAVRTGVTLMAASLAHLVGSLPRAIAYLMMGVIQYAHLAERSPRMGQQNQLLFELASCFDYLFYANCSFNWLIYCARVPQLRPWK